MRQYQHSYRVNANYSNNNGNPVVDDRDYYECFFWDIDIELPKDPLRSRDYAPICKMKLRALPTVGTYINFRQVLYVIKAICITSKESSYENDIYYDIEVKKVSSSEELD